MNGERKKEVGIYSGPNSPSRYNLFTLLFIIAGAIIMNLGTAIDGRAHLLGLAEVKESFLTPWHFVLYLGVLLNFIGVTMRNLKEFKLDAATWGAIVFALSGIADFWWHSTFGLEDGLAGVISPPHILIVVSICLMNYGAYVAAKPYFTPILQSYLVASSFFAPLFLVSLTNPLVNEMTTPANQQYLLERIDQPPFTALVQLPTVVGMAFVLYILLLGLKALQRHQLPILPAVVPFALSTLFLRDNYHYLFLVVGIFLIADFVMKRYKGIGAALIGFTFASGYFITLALTKGMAWESHLIAGSIVLAAVAAATSYITTKD